MCVQKVAGASPDRWGHGAPGTVSRFFFVSPSHHKTSRLSTSGCSSSSMTFRSCLSMRCRSLRIRTRKASLVSFYSRHDLSRHISQAYFCLTRPDLFKTQSVQDTFHDACSCHTPHVNFSGSGDRLRGALTMIHSHVDSEETRPFINMVTYATVLKGFVMARRAKDVFSTYEEVKHRGISLNTVTFNTMLDACAQYNAMHRASSLVDDMRQAVVELDLITYSTFGEGVLEEETKRSNDSMHLFFFLFLPFLCFFSKLPDPRIISNFQNYHYRP